MRMGHALLGRHERAEKVELAAWARELDVLARRDLIHDEGDVIGHLLSEP
jgi:hypothetical protein